MKGVKSALKKCEIGIKCSIQYACTSFRVSEVPVEKPEKEKPGGKGKGKGKGRKLLFCINNLPS